MINKFYLISLFIFLFNSASILNAQDKDIRILAPLYNFNGNIELVNDSILLNGYLVFEFLPENKELGLDASQKYFKFLVYFILDIDDLYSPYSFKLYYNSNVIGLLNYIAINDVTNYGIDSTNKVEKDRFPKIYNKYLDDYNKFFRVENLTLNDFTLKYDQNSFEIDLLNKRCFFVYKFKAYSYTFVSQVENILDQEISESYKLNLMFFQPITKAFYFQPANVFELSNRKFYKSNILENYLQLN